MRTVWHSLIWREWHEHKWKLAALSAILLSVQTYVTFESGAPVAAPVVFWFACMIPGVFFVAVRTATSERTLRTLEFTRALPIKTWQAAAVKLSMATIICLLPILLSGLMALGLHFWKAAGDVGSNTVALDSNARELQEVAVFGLVAAGMAISVLHWATAAASGQPNELRASAAAALVLIGWIIFGLLVGMMGPRLLGDAGGTLAECLIAAGPGGFITLLHYFRPRQPALDLVLQVSTLAVVATWTVRRFGQLSRNDNHSPGAAKELLSDESLVIARANWRPLTALAWKQWRESVPLCLTGVVLMASFAATRVAAMQESPFSESGLMAFRVMVLWTGAVTAIVVGIGSFASDLQPEIWAFWRSRPISVSAWFWIKYLAGAAAVLLFLDGPLVALDLLRSRDPLRWLTADVLLDVSIPLHLLAYTAAVSASCWVRQGVYAGILSLTMVLGIVTGPINWPSLQWLDVLRTLSVADRNGFADPSWFGSVYLPFAACMLTITGFVIALAWLAVRFDLGAHRLQRVSFRARLSSN